ncbi:hypothetical protein H0R92_13670 [Treponema sp. OMZ 840]|uniref:hypothetical protein n=1 Tax=Treponema sp. OMZ 840 TaxID=244313 RepID=UPI003D90900D
MAYNRTSCPIVCNEFAYGKRFAQGKLAVSMAVPASVPGLWKEIFRFSYGTAGMAGTGAVLWS